MEMGLLFAQLAIAATVILGSAHFMTQSADTIAEKTGLGRTFIGVVLLATATSLPELGTGITTIRLDQPDLAAGDAFGSNVFNLLIVGILDASWKSGALLDHDKLTPTTIIIGGAGIAIIAIAVMGIFIGGSIFSLGWISPISVLLLMVFLGAMWLIYRSEDNGGGSDEETERGGLLRAAVIYLIAMLIVVAAAIWLSWIGERMVHVTGLDASFVGTQFLALSTSLPELAASIAAIRIAAPELAISNVLGSNLFNMGFILFVDDAVLTSGSLWDAVAKVHILTAGGAILMTAIVIIALAAQSRARRPRRFTTESLLLVAVYILVSAAVFKGLGPA